jgi:hypothetical protein
MIIKTSQNEQNISSLFLDNPSSIKDPGFLRKTNIRNNVRNPRKYLRNPKYNPGNTDSFPTQILDTKGGVAQRIIIIALFTRKSTDGK